MVEIEELTKRYGRFLALDHVNFHINKGDIFGFVGPNGAGKTTTMRIMCGLIKATSGNVVIDGVNVLKRPAEVKRLIGYVPDFFGVYDNLKVMEYMEFYGSMYGMRKADVVDASERLLELVNLQDKHEAFVDSLSRGMKQRLCVARSLIHDPELLILDEPGSGLDPRSRVEMWNLLKRLSAMGKTIMISSHILPELSEMCDSIGVLDHGRMVASGNVDEILDHSDAVSPVRIKGYMLGMSAETSMDRISVIIKERFDVDRIIVRDDEIFVYYTGSRERDSELLRSLVDNGVHIHQFYRDRGDLESLFLEITGGGSNDCKTVR
jgi:ABC-2 type transport system ATP-binding protein